MESIAAEPVILKSGREKPILQRHPWVFSGAVESLPAGVEDGSLVEVRSRHRFLARGYLNRASQILVRLLSWDEDEVIDTAFWRRRLEAALARRVQIGIPASSTAYRIVNAENDYLPGLIVDRYGDTLVLQAGTLGIDRRKAELARLLLDVTGCRSVIERSDTAARRLEGLGEAHGLLAGDPPPDQVEIEEAGLHFVVDLSTGQKTGFYMDQRANRRRVAAYCAGGRVLNGFSYTGAFAVHALAAGARHVTNIDSSVEALELAETNLRRNGFDPDGQTDNIAGDIFRILRDWREAPAQAQGFDAQGFDTHRFDVVILDPPKFAQNRQSVERALRGYKDINLLALALLKPGGILATFSCSGLVSADLFQKVIFGAAGDAGRDVQILEWLRQDRDHPVALTFPEGEYLKGLICRVL